MDKKAFNKYYRRKSAKSQKIDYKLKYQLN